MPKSAGKGRKSLAAGSPRKDRTCERERYVLERIWPDRRCMVPEISLGFCGTCCRDILWRTQRAP